MEKLLEIYKDAFESTFRLIKSDGFKFFASIIALIFIAATSLLIAGMLFSGLYFLLILLVETVLLLPVYVKLFRFLDEY